MAGLVAVAAPPAPAGAAAHAAPWRFTSVSLVSSIGGYGTADGLKGWVLQCPAGYTAVSGGIVDGQSIATVHRLLEYPNPADGTYHVLAKNQSSVATSIKLTASCVWLDDVGTMTTVRGEFARNSSGFASGIVRCPAGTTVFSGGVDWSNTSPNRWIFYSTPITDGTTRGTGWYVAGSSDVSGVLGIELRCVSSSLLSGEYAEADDATRQNGPSAPTATAVCNTSGYRLLTGGAGPPDPPTSGGSYHGFSSVSGSIDFWQWRVSGYLPQQTDVLRSLALCVPASAVSVTFTQTPPALSNARSGSIQFTAADAAGEAMSVQCTLDGVDASCSSGTVNYGPLADGPHYFAVVVRNQSGSARTFAHSWTIDATAPVANVVQPSTPLKKATMFNVTWGGSDAGSGVRSYDVRHRTANFDGSFGPYALFQSATPTTSASFNATPGHTDCWSVRARDNAGNVSAYSPEKCTAVPVDDRALALVTGTWSRLSNSNAYQGTFSQASADRAKLQRTGVQAKRLNLLVTKCPTCGKVQVRLGSTLLATIDTKATTTQYKVNVPVATFSSVRTGTVSLTVSGAGKPVRIDGLGVTRV
jgi:hypothetical protein